VSRKHGALRPVGRAAPRAPAALRDAGHAAAHVPDAADIVAAARPERYCEATYRWWHWYYETRETIVAIVQTWVLLGAILMSVWGRL
jgi:hypothetical protein